MVAPISLGPSGNSNTTGGIRTITINRRLKCRKGQFILNKLVKINKNPDLCNKCIV